MIYTHPGQPQMQVEVILASISTLSKKPIYTIRMRYPRIIHGELMTHRLFSRNARSSRAVPVKTMLRETTSIPFVPWHWGKNRSGMQHDEDWDAPVLVPEWDTASLRPKAETESMSRERAWLCSRDMAVDVAEAMMDAGYHKQIPNRLLEPFSWIDTLITSTEWDNFLWLREDGAAEGHIRDLANLVHKAIVEAEPQELGANEWHLPYITLSDRDYANSICGLRQTDPDIYLCKISAARCARISYKPFDGDASYQRELERYDMLVSADRVHASPLEHQATPDVPVTISADVFTEDNETLSPSMTLPEREGYLQEHLNGNFIGWIQYRKMVPNESVMSGVL